MPPSWIHAKQINQSTHCISSTRNKTSTRSLRRNNVGRQVKGLVSRHLSFHWQCYRLWVRRERASKVHTRARSWDSEDTQRQQTPKKSSWSIDIFAIFRFEGIKPQFILYWITHTPTESPVITRFSNTVHWLQQAIRADECNVMYRTYGVSLPSDASNIRKRVNLSLVGVFRANKRYWLLSVHFYVTHTTSPLDEIQR